MVGWCSMGTFNDPVRNFRLIQNILCFASGLINVPRWREETAVVADQRSVRWVGVNVQDQTPESGSRLADDIHVFVDMYQIPSGNDQHN